VAVRCAFWTARWTWSGLKPGVAKAPPGLRERRAPASPSAAPPANPALAPEGEKRIVPPVGRVMSVASSVSACDPTSAPRPPVLSAEFA
jgi:hypothetical protein